MFARALNRLFRFTTILAKLFTFVACVAGVILTVFVVLASLMRYVLGSPFGFTEELVGLLFAALVFLALPYAAVSDQHIRVVIVTERLSPRLRLLAREISYVLILVFCTTFAELSWDFMVFSYQIDAKSDVARLILFPWMALMPICIVLLGVIVTIKLLLSLLGIESGSEEPQQPFG